MFVNADNTTDASEARGAEVIDVRTNRIQPEIIQERIRANVEPLNAKISALISCIFSRSKTTRRKLPQCRVFLPIACFWDPHLIGRPESLAPLLTRWLDLRDPRPTVAICFLIKPKIGSSLNDLPNCSTKESFK